MRLLIVGASGLIGGQAMHRFLPLLGPENVLGTYYTYPAAGTVFLDTVDTANPRNPILHDFAPTHILHAGALTHVDRCEAEPEASRQQTVQSTRNLLSLARAHKAHFTYLSTDYVFDGRRGPYTERDGVNPLGTYARHKLEAERLVMDNPGGALVLRVTNVYGDEDRGKNFVARLMAMADSDEPHHLRLPADQYATPINAADVAEALALLLPISTGLYHLASTDYMNRVQLAERVLARYPRHRVTIEGVTTAELGQAAPRPLMGGLIAAKMLAEFPQWRPMNADDYLQARVKAVP